MNKQQLVLLEDVCSFEFYDYEGVERKQVLSNISMEGFGGEGWAILGETAFELRLLLEIIANARAYETGTCVLAMRGMMRKKRLILPHVQYIGSTNMLIDHLKVIEYLYMLHKKSKDQNGYVLEKAILQDLVELGLGYLSLSIIGSLSAQEKALVSLCCALYSESSIIIMNLARLPFSMKEVEHLQTISTAIRKQNKIFLFSTIYPMLAQQCADNVLVLHEGSPIYSGQIQSFMQEYDKQILHIEDEHIQRIHDILIEKVKDCTFVCKDNTLDIFTYQDLAKQLHKIYRALEIANTFPRVMKKVEPSLANACREVKVNYATST